MKKMQAPWWASPGRPRHRLEACKVPPLVVELVDHRAVTVAYEELVKHAGCAEVAAVLCESSTFTSVETGGNSFPSFGKLYTRAEQLLGLWPGDVLRLQSAKPGRVTLQPMRPLALPRVSP